MKMFTAWARRAIRAATQIRFCPTGNAILLSILHDGPASNMYAPHNGGALITLLSTLSGCGDTVYVHTGRENVVYLLKLLAWYPHVRWLPTPPTWFRWDTVISDGTAPCPTAARCQWRIRYDYGPHMRSGPHDVAIPYPLCPAILHSNVAGSLDQRLDRLRESPRRARLLFAASLGEIYDRPMDNTVLGDRMTRLAVAAAIRSHEQCHEWTTGALPDIAFAGQSLIYRNCSTAPLPSSGWLDTLAAADFYVCAPGCIMPMCFSAIESMGVGTIPFTNYPDWFAPALEPGVNCIAFESPETLRMGIDEILRMPKERVAEMRRACIDYFVRYLDRRSVMPRIRAIGDRDVTLHVLDESFQSLGIGRRNSPN